MPELGIVVRLSARVAIVHYVDCPCYQRAQRRHIPLTSRMKVRGCTWCHPSEEDIRSNPPDVEWYPYGPAPLANVKVHQVDVDWEVVEAIAARNSLGWGKTPARRKGWAA